MNRIVYFGDSITWGFEQLNNHDNVVNLGISGNKTTDLIGRFSDVIKEQPDIIFVMIGTNDFLVKHEYWGDKIIIDIEATYHALLSLIRDNLPNAKVYLISIPPIRVDDEKYDSFRWNLDIDYMNTFIQHEALSFGFKYLNLADKLKDTDQELKPEYTTDGVHFSTLGYRVYYDFIKSYLNK